MVLTAVTGGKVTHGKDAWDRYRIAAVHRPDQTS